MAGGSKTKRHSRMHEASTAKRKRARWLYCLFVRRALDLAGDDDEWCTSIIQYAAWRLASVGLYLTDKYVWAKICKMESDGRSHEWRQGVHECKQTYYGILSHLHRIDLATGRHEPEQPGLSWNEWIKKHRWNLCHGRVGKHNLSLAKAS